MSRAASAGAAICSGLVIGGRSWSWARRSVVVAVVVTVFDVDDGVGRSSLPARTRGGGDRQDTDQQRANRVHVLIQTSGKWQATGCSRRPLTSSGSSWAQRSSARQHRVRNRQPDGGSSALGSSPRSTIRCRRVARPGRAPAPPTAAPACTGAWARRKPSVGPARRSCPRCITATRSAMWRTTERSCAINR